MAAPNKRMKSKRDREKGLQEKRKEKMERRTARRIEKDSNPRPVGGEDPDLAGIVPGPQPPLIEDEPPSEN